MEHVCCRCCNPNTGVQDTTDLACICNEARKKIWNTHQHTHTHAHKMHGLCDEHIEEEHGCGPPVAQRTIAASGWQSKVLFFGSGLLLAILNNSLWHHFLQIIQNPHPHPPFSAHYSKNRHEKHFSPSGELMNALLNCLKSLYCLLELKNPLHQVKQNHATV